MLTPFWTKDGEGIVLQARGHPLLWAIDGRRRYGNRRVARARE